MPMGDDVPDWMRSSVAEPAPNANSSPDWLAGLSAPTDAPAEPQAKAVAGGTDWLNDLFGEQGGETSAPPAEPAPGHTGMTGWLDALQEEMAPSQMPAASTQPVDENVPPWLNATEAADAAPPTLAEDVPDWMKPASAPAASSGGDDDLPAWLATAGAVDATGTAQEDVPAWLTGEVEPEPTPTNDVPDWRQASQVSQAAPVTNDIPAWLAGGDEVPEEPAAPVWSAAPVAEEPPAAISDDIPDWLKASQAEEPAASDDVPAWLASTDDRTVEIPSADAWAAANDDTVVVRGKT
jgi:hypothetical protein